MEFFSFLCCKNSCHYLNQNLLISFLVYRDEIRLGRRQKKEGNLGIIFNPNFAPSPTSLILGLFSFHEQFKNAASSSLRQVKILESSGIVMKLTDFPLITLIRLLTSLRHVQIKLIMKKKNKNFL